MNNIYHPKMWDQYPEETDLSFHYFSCYLQLGAKRSYTKVREMYGKAPSYERQIQRWASRNKWVERASEYDQYFVRKTLEKKADELDKLRARFINEAFNATDELFRIARYREIDAIADPTLRMTETDIKILPTKLKAILAILDRAGLVPLKEQDIPEPIIDKEAKLVYYNILIQNAIDQREG